MPSRIATTAITAVGASPRAARTCIRRRLRVGQVVYVRCRSAHDARRELCLELVQVRLLLFVAVLRPNEVDELLRDEALAQQQRHRALAEAHLEHEPLALAAEFGPREIRIDRVALARHRADHRLEAVARARSAE